jgi:hypothetical protein
MRQTPELAAESALLEGSFGKVPDANVGLGDVGDLTRARQQK